MARMQGDYPMSAADVLKLIEEKEIQFVDLRFTDTKGKEQHERHDVGLRWEGCPQV